MKRKELNDLKTKEIEALKKMATETRIGANKKKMESVGGKDKNLKSSWSLRKNLAQIMTVIKEKEIIESLQPKAEDK